MSLRPYAADLLVLPAAMQPLFCSKQHGGTNNSYVSNGVTDTILVNFAALLRDLTMLFMLQPLPSTAWLITRQRQQDNTARRRFSLCW
jgi:hypothetical protein